MKNLYVYDNEGKKRKAKKVICKQCGKEFLKEIRFLDRHKNNFCSRDCSSQYQKTSIEIECAYCGEICEKTPSKIKTSKTGFLFCDRKCKELAQSLDGGGKFTELRPNHYGMSNGKYDYRKRIFSNSEKKCVDCGEDKKYLLCVHHIDGNRNNNVLENLEIVCANCHRKRHLEFINDKWCYKTTVLTNREQLGSI